MRQVADDVAFPNGMAVTPDNAMLILAESYGNRLTAFDIAANGTLANRRVWAGLDAPPDGICLDVECAVWCGAGTQCLRIREGGEVVQRIEMELSCFACMLGGKEMRTLFMLAAEWRGPETLTDGSRTGQVLTTRAPAPGAGWP